jgi:hypothetical protein
MRYLVFVLAGAFVLAGCLDNGGLETPGEGEGHDHSLIEVVETYSGDLLTMHGAALFQYSHDQLGDNHREFWVVNGTKELHLELQTTDKDLEMRAVGPDCYQETLQKHGFEAPPSCVYSAATDRGSGNLTIADPAEGAWMVYFFMAAHSQAQGAAPADAEDVPYLLTVTKLQPPHEPHQVEDYPGELVVAHLGAIRISPDQAGDVYREFWVHEGTKMLELEFEASEDVYLAYGNNFRQRDRMTEQGIDTVDGKANLTFKGDDLHIGGWYFIVFHETTDLPLPNVQEVSYHMTVTKHHGHEH